MVINIIKKVIKTFALSFLGAYLPLLISFTIFFLRRSEPLLGTDLPNYIGWVMFIAIVPFIYNAPITTLILYIASLLDKRVLNKWFVSSFSFYGSVVVSIFLTLENKSLWFLNNIWYFWGIILIPLVVVIILMNIKKWKMKFK